MAQADMFLKLTNIKGEALDAKHKDEIEVLSWSFGSSQSGSAHGGTGSGTGKVQIQDLKITTYVDKAETDLRKARWLAPHAVEKDADDKQAASRRLEPVGSRARR